MTDRLRIGVLGTGAIVREFHLPALLDNPRVEVAALGNQRSASLEHLARAHGIKRTYTDFSLLAADPEIDAVVNALPNYLHAPVSIEMLQAGKHVLCEKPMAMSVAEAQAMLAAAAAAQRKLVIAHPWRASREYAWLRAVIEAGTIGAVIKVRAHAVLAGGGPPPTSWFVRPEFAGGGALTDVGIHSIDTISYVFDDRVHPVTVFARSGTHFQPIQVEDTATVLIEYDNGMVAEIEAGWHHAYASSPLGAMELFGAKGYARTFPHEAHCSMGGVPGVYFPSMPASASHIGPAMYAAQIDRFLDCVLHDAPPACDGRHGLMGMQVLEAAYRSARNGQAVSLAGGL
jgi:predicted dehydrogenase